MIVNTKLSRLFNIAVCRGLLASSLLLGAGSLRAQSDDERFVDGLRTRHLFGLAEAYCLERLASGQLADQDRAELTNQLIRTHTAHAVNSPPRDRKPLWKQAHDVAIEFGAHRRDNPRLVLIRVQDALTHLAHGELVRKEWEVGAGEANARDAALAQIRRAADLLEQIDQDLTKTILERTRRTSREEELSPGELRSLQNNVRYQLARAFRNRALCYEKGSDDRVDALSRVLEKHGELLLRLRPGDKLGWPVRIEQIKCRRLLGELAESEQRLGELLKLRPPPKYQLLARAEAVRIELARNRPQAARTILAVGRTVGALESAELDFAHLEAFAALARAAAESNDKDTSAKWQELAESTARHMEEIHGPYWGRMASLFLVRSFSSGTANNLDILVRVADEMFLKNQFEDAIAAYEKAAVQAKAGGQSDQAFQLLYKAALVEHGRKRHTFASRRFRRLALDTTSHPKASDAHLLAAWNVSRLAGKDPQTLSLYADLLDEHLATWPEADSADTARMWLGRLRENQRAWVEALDLYLEVSQPSSQWTAAVEAAARCARQYFAEQKAEGRDDPEQAKLMAQRFEDLVFGADGKAPDRLSPAQQSAAVAAARLWLGHTTDGHARAAEVLRAAVDGSPGADPSWKTTVQSLLVVALAGQGGRRNEAQAILRELADGQTNDLFDMLRSLAALGQSAQPPVQVEIAKLQLETVRLLSPKRNALQPAEQLTLDILRAEALANARQRGEANKVYQALAKAHPKDGRIQMGFGEFLLAADDEKSVQAALTQWRKIAIRSRPHSERWYRAKYSVARALLKLGRKQDAAQRLRYIKETPPGWEKSPLRSSLETLLKQCET